MKTLDALKKNHVEYCIPLWLRDEQVKSNIKRVSGRVQAYHEKRSEPIAVVCFGPSLKQTWEELKNYQYIITCSGAHKFLLDRGIIPTWHCEVDPREHKIKLLGQPHPNVEYLISSTCSPKLIDYLQGYNIKLWHVFSQEEEVIRLLPPEEWAVTGGCAAGLRAMTLARFMGFTNQHIYGMDGNSDPSTNQLHSAEHPNEAKNLAVTEYKGKTYNTTPGFLEAAQQTLHELDMMPDVVATFHGEGLVQEMVKDYVRKPIPPGTAIIAFNKPALISDEYRELNKQLHENNPFYGVGGGKYAKTILELSKSLKTTSILDYGCGKGYMAKEIPFPIWEYDPAIPGKDTPPRPADIVVCTDVLEHIEPEKLPFVLSDLARCTKQVGYFVISTRKAQKTLPDGRNTHLIVHGGEWWHKRLKEYFQIGKIIYSDKEQLLHVIVGVKINADGSKKKTQANKTIVSESPTVEV